MTESETPSNNSGRIRRAYETARAALLAEMLNEPVAADDPVQKLLDAPVTEFRHWVGELSTSALSTATAVMALEQMRRQYVLAGRDVTEQWLTLIRGGVEWLIAHQNADGGWGDTVKSLSNISTTMLCHAVLVATHGSLSPLAPPGRGVGGEGQRADGTSSSSPLTPSPSPQRGEGSEDTRARSAALDSAQAYITKAGGVPALIARYGKDRTFSVPILTHCALAGLVDWKEVLSLPFELACIPAKFYAAVRLPVVSYALPALIAIGQVRFHFRPSRNPLRRWLQRWAKPASLKVLERIQPTNGGFLEATPLTSFVTMSLAAMGLHDHPVAQRGIEFIVKSARRDDVPPPTGLAPVARGSLHYSASRNPSSAETHEPPTQGRWGECERASWPIDTNLATWVTTLSINALGDDVPLDARPGLRAWLLRQQYRVVHPYTNAAPGGWAWTNLPGGVPDADDTPGAMLALMELERSEVDGHSVTANQKRDLVADLQSQLQCRRWLVSLQNRDGGWPTFCRGWGTLPFDRSSPDISAHAIRALHSPNQTRTEHALEDVEDDFDTPPSHAAIANAQQMQSRYGDTLLNTIVEWAEVCDLADKSVDPGLRFLKRTQRPDGSWLPLWFGNQHAPNDENPTYGTAKVLAAFQALGRMSDESAVRGVRWLVANQNPDGGWGAGPGTPSSVEETALALEALLGSRESASPEFRVQSPVQDKNSEFHRSGLATLDSRLTSGLSWLIARVEDGRYREPSPIGFYFAKLWYFEALYPLIFTVAALRKAAAICGSETTAVPRPSGSGPA